MNAERIVSQRQTTTQVIFFYVLYESRSVSRSALFSVKALTVDGTLWQTSASHTKSLPLGVLEEKTRVLGYHNAGRDPG